MIVLKTIQDVVEQVKDVVLYKYITELNDQLIEDVETERAQDLEFVSYFGGDIHIVESSKDLVEISLPSSWGADEDKNITQGAEVFDIARYCCKGKYAEILLITNNGGGNTYFIPYSVVKQCKNVHLSIRMTIESEHAAANASRLLAAENETLDDLGDVRYDDGMDEAKDIQEEMKKADKEYGDFTDTVEIDAQDRTVPSDSDDARN